MIQINLDKVESDDCLALWNASNYNAKEHNCADFVRWALGIEHTPGKALSEEIEYFVSDSSIMSMTYGDIVFTNNFSHVGVCVGYPYVTHYTKDGLITESYIRCFGGGYVYRMDRFTE